MKKEQFEAWSIDYLRNELGTEQRQEFEAYLKENSEKADELRSLLEMWDVFDTSDTPEPSQSMDAQFFQFLGDTLEKGQTKPSNLRYSLSKSLGWLLRPQLAYGIILLAVGLSLGYFLRPDPPANTDERTVVDNKETEQVREQLVLTLLEQPSANKRLQGVSEVSKIEKVNAQVMQALLQTLNNDPNVNVRLAAIESLTNYVYDPLVRQGLIQSIPNQESPIVQVTLANLMSALQEKKSIEPFKQLLQKKELDTTVKKKIENTIQSII